MFNYSDSVNPVEALTDRKGARRIAEVPAEVLAAISVGAAETVNLMEWLAADMSMLARAVASEFVPALREALFEAAEQVGGRGVTERLRLLGSAIARALPELAGPEFEKLALHRGDLVRQWACYAVNDPVASRSLSVRLTETLRFASDTNMSVRESAWMAFRSHLAQNLDAGLELLEPLSKCENANVRRFVVEVTRPRSVWGAHLDQLKRQPGQAIGLLENTRADSSRYVRLAVGNWLNDASKTRPDWVAEVCDRWAKDGNPHTDFIVRRGLRSIIRSRATAKSRWRLL